MKLKALPVVVASLLLSLVPLSATEAEDILAKVNGVGITQAEFDRNWNTMVAQGGVPPEQMNDPAKLSGMKQEFLNTLINQELLYQEAESKNLLPDEESTNEELSKVQNRFPDREAFLAALKQAGISEEIYLESLRRSAAIRKLIEVDIAKNLAVTDEEVHDYYQSNQNQFKIPEQVHARHILIKVTPDADDSAKSEAKKKIDSIYEKAVGGADFAELAKEFSEGPSGPQGGDLGFFGRGRMVKPFEDVAFTLKPGDISDPVETRFGYHIIKVEERKDGSVAPEEEVKDSITSYLFNQKINQAVMDHADNIRRDAHVEILEEF
jgi:peptidyl-prolyl cis-trans isomerase C